eukprot:TRINITY_DN9547_c1_g1_i1.p1 TRINITY_DN9547_c1_g1~~TRINITY_DN9547_c1_g1_i1.p1  ORF type:complete len:209 (+),score=35.19 TRINITY_DN9547_c1_g1_i1:117-743(+)
MASAQTAKVIQILNDAREDDMNGRLCAAKKGSTLPERRALEALDCNSQKRKAECNKFWDERRKRMKDAVNALGLIDPGIALPLSKAPPGTPARAPPATPARVPGTPAGSTKITPSRPAQKPDIKKQRKAPPTPAVVKKNVAPENRPEPASSSITTEQWDSAPYRCLMSYSQSKYDVCNDYVMPGPLNIAVFRDARARFKAQAPTPSRK